MTFFIDSLHFCHVFPCIIPLYSSEEDICTTTRSSSAPKYKRLQDKIQSKISTVLALFVSGGDLVISLLGDAEEELTVVPNNMELTSSVCLPGSKLVKFQASSVPCFSAVTGACLCRTVRATVGGGAEIEQSARQITSAAPFCCCSIDDQYYCRKLHTSRSSWLSFPVQSGLWTEALEASF